MFPQDTRRRTAGGTVCAPTNALTVHLTQATL